MEDNNNEKHSGNFLGKLIASEVLFYAGYNWYVHAYAPVDISGASLVVWNVLITGGIFLFLSLFDQ